MAAPHSLAALPYNRGRRPPTYLVGEKNCRKKKEAQKLKWWVGAPCGGVSASPWGLSRRAPPAFSPRACLGPQPLRLDIKRQLSARSDRVKCVDIHPTEPWMLAALYNGTVNVWNYETQTLVKTFEVCDLPVRAAKFVLRKSWLIAGAVRWSAMRRVFSPHLARGLTSPPVHRTTRRSRFSTTTRSRRSTPSRRTATTCARSPCTRRSRASRPRPAAAVVDPGRLGRLTPARPRPRARQVRADDIGRHDHQTVGLEPELEVHAGF